MPDTDPTLQTLELDELPGGETPPPEEPQIPPTEEPQAPPPDDLRTVMTELAGTVRKIAEPTPPAAPPPTPEQIAEYWAVYDPEASDKEFFKKFFRLGDETTPEMLQAHRELFAGVQKGLMRQAVTAARNYIEMLKDELKQEYAPIREYVESSQREATRGRFYGTFPALDDKRFHKIIDATARALDNKTFDSEEAYFKALAEGAAESIKEILPEFDLGAKPQTKKPGQTPRLPRTSAGGGGGAGKGATHDALQPTGRANDIDSLELDTE